MNFGKITLGALLLAIGVLLLAVRTGFAHPDTPILLLRYWPVLLIAFGLAFLAGAIKNPMLGCFAILIILGGVALGIFWMKRAGNARKVAGTTSSLDLSRAHVSSLLVRVYTFGGSVDVGASPSRTITVLRRDAAVDSIAGYRFDVNGGKAVLVWPGSGGTFSLSAPGAQVAIRAPTALPVALRWSGRLGSLHADLTHLVPTRCHLHEIFSTGKLEFSDAARPEEIRVWGVASSLRVRIPPDCPVRVVSESPLVLRSLPSDFEELAMGRGKKQRVDAADGRGRPVTIHVDGPFMRIAVERMPQTALRAQAVETREDMEWLPPTGTASRSRSPSS
ncbi:MAG TPA: DUF5668 domain-containing protein [Candidatus Polarisedimenticolia bacterium]|nr:DUF5668 domain-containing protein [Candidatus Polarisedimenticolia bacterium]